MAKWYDHMHSKSEIFDDRQGCRLSTNMPTIEILFQMPSKMERVC
jgi:hypothetical protein